jgi:hypothetical protein
MCGRDQRGRTDVNGWVEGDDGVLLRFISIVPLLVLLSGTSGTAGIATAAAAGAV